MSARQGMGAPSDHMQVDALCAYLSERPVTAYQQPERTKAGVYLSAVLGTSVAERPWTYCSTLSSWAGGVTLVFALPVECGGGWGVLCSRDEDNPDDGKYPWVHLWGTGARIDRVLEWAQQARTAESLPALAIALTAEILRHEEEFFTYPDSLNYRSAIWSLSHVLDEIPKADLPAVRSLMALRHNPAAVAELLRLIEVANVLVENLPHADATATVFKAASVVVTGTEMREFDIDSLCVGEALMQTPRARWETEAVTILGEALAEQERSRQMAHVPAHHGDLFSPATL